MNNGFTKTFMTRRASLSRADVRSARSSVRLDCIGRIAFIKKYLGLDGVRQRYLLVPDI